MQVVFGPALDGGYYLVGVSVEPHGLFKVWPALLLVRGLSLFNALAPGCASVQEITWSTNSVLEQSVARAKDLGFSVAPAGSLPVLRDIDTIEVINTFAGIHFFCCVLSCSLSCKRTAWVTACRLQDLKAWVEEEPPGAGSALAEVARGVLASR